MMSQYPLDIITSKTTQSETSQSIGTNYRSDSNQTDPQLQAAKSVLQDEENKPNLYRPNTINRWNSSDIQDLEDEMKQQLLSMKPQLSSVTNHKMVTKNTMTTIDEVDSFHIKRGSNLIQSLSCDWDSEDMDLEENQMKKHLNHLKTENDCNHLN